MHRTPEVIDCWFDSGSMPFAQWHYPFENKETFEAAISRLTSSPRPSIRRAAGSIRCWPSPRCCSTERPLKTASSWATFRTPRAARCPSTSAMSSIRGRCWTSRARTPCAGISTPRAPRGCPPASPAMLVSEMQRKFMGTLWNTYAFFTLYASIDNYDPLTQTRSTGRTSR